MWLDDLLQQVDYRQYYPKGKNTGTDQIITNCSFHQDKHASMSVNLRNGCYFCHACSASGNFITWCKHFNVDLKELAVQLGIEVKKQKTDRIISKKTVDEMHENLLNNQSWLQALDNNRGINLNTIKRFNLGTYKNRLSIPIYNLDNDAINIRLYASKGVDARLKMISWGAGYGEARLYPIENIYSEEIMLCEGEMDCLLANQMGYNAITGTTGANTFKEQWSKFFKDKIVNIIYDIDAGGKTGSQKCAKMLKENAKQIKIINLPIDLNDIPNGDLTDFIVSLGNNKSDLDKIISETKIFTDKEEKEEKVFNKVPLSQATNSKYNKQYIKTTALISGKDIESFIVPKKIRATCTISAGKICGMCPMNFENGELKKEIKYDDENLLRMIDCNSAIKDNVIKDIIAIPTRCRVVNIKETESYNIEELLLTPQIEYTTSISEDDNFVTRSCYYVGHNIKTNQVYNFKGKTLAHPTTQYATHIFFDVDPAKTSVESFKFTPEIHQQLKKFQCENIDEKINDIYETTIQHVTEIKGRQDMFTLIMMTYCSPNAFNFNQSLVNKGWIEGLILGDTRTGKTAMVKSLIEYFKIGELVLGESASFAGLVGGLQQVGNRWHLTWGRIPLNNGRLVAIDEMSGLSIFEIGKLSGIRSSGIAEITKIRTERTWARTRLIWMSNPRGSKEQGQKQLSAYTQGVRSVPELIGKNEDISRFDLILLLGINEVDMNEINKPLKKPNEIKYSGQNFHNLIMWIWKLKPKNINITDEAVEYIYDVTNLLSDKYTQSIPLIVPSEQRIKIARMAISIAAMVYSTNDGKQLDVHREHVDFVYKYIQKIYDKPICGYDEYSRLDRAKYTIGDRDKIIDLLKNNEDAIDQFLDIDKITHGDLQDILSIDSRSDLRKALNTLISCRAIKRAAIGYIKTPAYIQFLRELKLDGALNKKEQELNFDHPPF